MENVVDLQARDTRLDPPTLRLLVNQSAAIAIRIQSVSRLVSQSVASRGRQSGTQSSSQSFAVGSSVLACVTLFFVGGRLKEMRPSHCCQEVWKAVTILRNRLERQDIGGEALHGHSLLAPCLGISWYVQALMPLAPDRPSNAPHTHTHVHTHCFLLDALEFQGVVMIRMLNTWQRVQGANDALQSEQAALKLKQELLQAELDLQIMRSSAAIIDAGTYALS